MRCPLRLEKLQYILWNLEGHVHVQGNAYAQERVDLKLSPLTILQALHRQEVKDKVEL